MYNENNLSTAEPPEGFYDYTGEASNAFRKAGKIVKHERITQYYDYLMRIAAAKCATQEDAEDLVGDTMLAAFAYLHTGGTIDYPKTWLSNTLYHKHNDSLRKKYRAPTIVCLDEGLDVLEADEISYLSSEEAAGVRKELNHLAHIVREVLIRYYYGNQSVAEISKALGIPEGTVKSRLSAGRSQIKKGLETMEEKENYLPGRMNLTFGGSVGPKWEPAALVEGDLIAQNLLILAYEKPVTVSELSKAIGIPAAYIEPIIKKLVDGELMAATDSGRVYTDFIVIKANDTMEKLNPQLAFAHKHFDVFWNILQRMSDRIFQLPYVRKMKERQKTKLDRYAVLKALQDFQYIGVGNVGMPKFPKRRDGGRWIAQATVFEAGYNEKAYREASEYMIHGGHRRSEEVIADSTKRVRLYEFDTTLFDSPHRYGNVYVEYFQHIIPLLWHIQNRTALETTDIPNPLISYIPTLETLGMIERDETELRVGIPVLEGAAFEEVCAIIRGATEEMQSAIGTEFAAFTALMKTPVPKHLTSVPELFRYQEATNYFVMAIVREACEKGLHLSGVDYCCPPAVLVYEE